MVTKQAVLGLSLMIGGSVMVLALANKPSTLPDESVVFNPHSSATPPVFPEPLTADIETEAKILAQKQQQREAQVKLLEEKTKKLLQEQALARQQALDKASFSPAVPVVVPHKQAQNSTQKQATAQEPSLAKVKSSKEKKPSPVIKTRPQKYTVQAGDSLFGLSRRYGVSVAAMVAANGISGDTLRRGQVLTIPTVDVKSAKAAQAKNRVIDERLKNARRHAKKQGINENYAVQVALAATPASGEQLAQVYQQAGYSARVVQDGRLIRVVMVERSRDAAVALKEKLGNDPSVTSHGAWIVQLKS